jgi:ribosomal protein L11 methyltransferase
MARASRRKSPDPALFQLRVTVSPAIADDAGAWLVESGAGGVIQETAGRRAVLVTYGEAPALRKLAGTAIAALGRGTKAEVLPAPAAVSGWQTAWMEYLEPVAISRELMLVPLREGARPDAGRTDVVWLEPALAFGFGEHATTRMAAKVVERLVRAGAGRVLDVGTGSGVLALVALHAGAEHAVGVDVDAEAVRAAKQNARLNGMVKRAGFSRTPVARVTGAFDVVVANVDRRTLLDLAAPIARRVSAGGSLVVTGILDDDREDVEAGYRALGLTPALRLHEGGFLLVCFRAAKRGAGDAARAPKARARTVRKTTRKPRSR